MSGAAGQPDAGKLPARLLRLSLSLLPIPALLLLRPLAFTPRQCLILGILLVVIIWWVTGWVERTAASLVLLAVFFLFSTAPTATILTFPRSENFLIIVLSFLFSQGISNSGLTRQLFQPLLFYASRSLGKLMAVMALACFAMIFIIPQPFSRIIVHVLIFRDFWDKIGLKDPLRSTLFFLLFVYSAVLNMTMRRGDLILNHALLTMGGVSISEGDWLRAMALPTLVFTALVTLLFLAVFRRELKDFHSPASDILAVSTEKLSRKDLRNLLVILLVVVLWALEDLHGISGTVIVTLGTAVLFPLGLLHLSDLRTINVKLLVFLTAAFSIGGVLKAVGVADVLFQQLATLFPETFSLGYVALVLGISMAMHMLLGSNVTTMSVVVPGLMAAGAGVTAEPVLLLLIYLGICGHFLFPFHHVLLLLEEGDGCYTSLQTFRLGLPLTLVTLLCGMFLYLGWWRLIGLF